jgi:hypothetical protein
MKVDQLISEKESIQTVSQAEQKKKVEHVGRIKLYKGQKLYELDLKQKLIFIPTMTEEAVDITGAVRKKYVVREGCLYVTAINLKNAERKFIKML